MPKDTNARVAAERIICWDDFVRKTDKGHYKGWAFRGQRDASWPLLSTLGRRLKAYIKEEHWDAQEARIIRIFQRKAHLFLTHIPPQADIFQWLALIQHHGGPTRLLDFTWSPFVAAFFALESAQSTGVVWAINPKRLANVTERLPAFLGDEGTPLIGIGEPFVMNARLIAQSGTFVVTKQVGRPLEEIVVDCPTPDDVLFKLVLDGSDLRSDAMRSLFTMNISYATLFPDVNGLAQSLAYELEYHFAYDPHKTA